jgi:hypothetical protein
LGSKKEKEGQATGPLILGGNKKEMRASSAKSI